ncbi:STAS domain-containing protein [Candidatus Viridilinea mediisalina]|uniref:Anti-sigma factor antagonist n=1 Tax=Candidatus Viridilinea mediisalina TaxID=2024553 RepID=A0A2A6RHF0_9CHLR|nr:STAS domain-containing protein [Candidatus Viridilinea mediisalina]PDW02373.1 anti-anti-sigma factor [Candidatus Viridilinea mediisalina]
MEMTTRLHGDVNILELIGRFDTNTVPPVAAWLDQVTSTPGARVLVNLTHTTFVDSTALATLVQAMKRCQQYKGTLLLCGMRRPVYMIFELTRLDKAFSIYPDEEQAMQAFTN